MTWHMQETEDGARVMPVGDLVGHEEGEDCVCGPRLEPVVRDDGSVGWLVSHEALDGRA